MVNCDCVLNHGDKTLGFEETERQLGLPGAGDKSNTNYGKRGFEETNNLKRKNLRDPEAVKPPTKAHVMGWQPVWSFRKNVMVVQNSEESSGGGAFVKVSMDGAPYLRIIDLKMYNTYQQLSDALGKMFSSFTIGKNESQSLMDFINEGKLMDLLNSSDYVPSYEDKDGDWMLVGDVPWDMFVESCKRLRIMKGTETKGLAPRVMRNARAESEVKAIM